MEVPLYALVILIGSMFAGLFLAAWFGRAGDDDSNNSGAPEGDWSGK